MVDGCDESHWSLPWKAGLRQLGQRRRVAPPYLYPRGDQPTQSLVNSHRHLMLKRRLTNLHASQVDRLASQFWILSNTCLLHNLCCSTSHRLPAAKFLLLLLALGDTLSCSPLQHAPGLQLLVSAVSQQFSSACAAVVRRWLARFASSALFD